MIRDGAWDLRAKRRKEKSPEKKGDPPPGPLEWPMSSPRVPGWALTLVQIWGTREPR